MGILSWLTGSQSPSPPPQRIEPAIVASTAKQPGDIVGSLNSMAFPQPLLYAALGGYASNTGVPVTPFTALQSAAVYGCTKCISEDIAGLPLQVRRRTAGGQWMIDTVHPLNRLFAKPNRWMSAWQFWSYALTAYCLRGNSYIVIQRDRTGAPVELIPVTPDRVTVKLSVVDGQPWYLVNARQIGIGVWVAPEDMLHMRNMSVDGYLGLSPIACAQDVVGLALAAQQHGAILFRQGAQLSGYIKHPGRLSKEAGDNIGESWRDTYSGVQNAHKTAVLEEGMQFEKLAITNEDAQFLQTRQFQVLDICLAPGAEVITPTGPQAIETLEPGNLVLTHRGRWRKITAVSQRDYVGQAVTVQAKSLDRITATSNHPFLVQIAKPNRQHRILQHRNPIWLNAGNLHKSTGGNSRLKFVNLTMPRLAASQTRQIDLAPWMPPRSLRTTKSSERNISPYHDYPGCYTAHITVRGKTFHLGVFDDIEEAKQARDRAEKELDILAPGIHDGMLVCRRDWHLKRYVDANYDFGWICGLYAGDGSSSDHQIIFYLGWHEQALVAELLSKMRIVFGLTGTVRKQDSVARITYSSRVLASMFHEFGTAAHRKALPSWCLQQSEDFNRGIIDGAVASDGHIRGTSYQIRSTSRILVWQIRLLIWQFGRTASIVRTAAKEQGVSINGRIYDRREIYSLNWRWTMQRRGIGGVSNDYIYFRIADAVHHTYSGKVFNIEVEEDESYATTAGIVHNCRMYRVPPHKVMDYGRATFNNIDAQQQSYVDDALSPCTSQLEGMMKDQLLFDDERPEYETHFDYTGLLRGDTIRRYQTYQIGLANGFLNRNEVRAAENMNPIPGPMGSDYTITAQPGQAGADAPKPPMPSASEGEGSED